MSTYWNIRKILGLEPGINTCVGYTCVDSTESYRCRNIPGFQHREQAAILIDRLDRQGEVSADDFVKLAKLLLCRHKHNNKKFPRSNQVREKGKEWDAVFKKYKEGRKIESVLENVPKVPATEPNIKIDVRPPPPAPYEI
jgi:hypothetical protein